MGRYFMDLKYSVGDEDASVECGILPEGARHVMAVAGSGARVVPLLARKPVKLTCVDVMGEQLALTELRIEALRRLEHKEYVEFLGYQTWSMTPSQREKCFESIPISRVSKEYLGTLFQGADWQPIAYLGNYERSMASLARTIRMVLKERGIKIFELNRLERQKTYFESEFPKKRWDLVVRILAWTAAVNSFLYKGVYPKRNRPGSTFSIFHEIFQHLLYDRLARESFNLQLMFLGEVIHPEGNPIECDPKIYAMAAEGARKAGITYVEEDVLCAVEKTVDFMSLSDVPSYLGNQDKERGFMADLGKVLKPGAIVVYRGHLRYPDPDTSGFESIIDQYQDLIAEEKTQLWKFFAWRRIAE